MLFLHGFRGLLLGMYGVVFKSTRGMLGSTRALGFLMLTARLGFCEVWGPENR